MLTVLAYACLTMNAKTKDLETEARQNVAKLRKIKGMEKLADSFTRLMDGAAAGGVARAKKLSKKRRTEIAKKAANTRWGKQ